MPAQLSLLSYLPRPAAVQGEGVSKLLNGELLAYSAGAAAVVIDVKCMRQVASLVGGHSNATITALDWHPLSSVADSKAAMPLTLATGDSEGRVVVWDVLNAAPIATIEDAFRAGFGSADAARRADAPRPAVKGLAWATATNMLTVLLSPGYLLLWDCRSGSIVWRRDLGPSDAFSSIQTDPTDRRRVALTTAAGAFATLRLDSPSSDRVRYQRFQAEITAGTLQCSFPGVRELLLLLLHRELIVFDVEYGQPAASTPLPGSMPAFDTIIGSYGHAVASVGADEPGIDAIYCAHVDGSVSLWQRVENSLKYTLAGHFPMLSSQSWMGRSGGGGGGSSGGAHGNSSTTGVNKILSWVSAPWTASASGTAELQGASQATAIGAMERQQGAPHPGRVLQLNPAGQDGSSGTLATSNNKKIQAQKGNALLLMALATDGSWWKWELPLLQGTLPAASSNKPSGAQDTSPAQTLPPPRLLGALHSLSHRITAFSAYPGLIGLSNSPHCAAAGVAGTASGSLELVTIQQGRLTALHSAVSASLDAHSGPVKGVRWLGRSPRAVSFSSERNPAGEYMNSLLVTDFRSGGSIAFREGSGEAAPLTGVRASAAGAYVLLIFRGLPSEVWAVPEGALPYRLRQIDLQFTSVEFLPEDFGTLPAAATDVDVVFWGAGATSSSAGDRALASSSTGTGASAATPSGNMSGGGGAPGGARASSPRSAEDLPEERLVFTLADGRMGILSVKGRKIQDTKPRMPTWTRLATGEFRATSTASWGSFVLLGGADGTLVRWDTATGHTAVIDSGCGRIHKIYVAPSPTNDGPPGSPGRGHMELARVAVLSASGTFAVFALDVAGQVQPTGVGWEAATSRVGRAIDIDWLAMPRPLGMGAVVAVALESGALAMVNTAPPPGFDTRRLSALAGWRTSQDGEAQSPTAPAITLATAPPAASPLLLPRAWRRVLAVLIQQGAPVAALRDAGSSRAMSEDARDKMEADLAACLPPQCAAAFAAQRAQRAASLELASPKDATPEELNDLLQAMAAAPVGSPGRDSSSSSIEAAAFKLGYRQTTTGGRSGGLVGRGAETFKTIGGSVKGIAKDVASASKDQLSRTLGRGGGGGGSLWDSGPGAPTPSGVIAGGVGTGGGMQALSSPRSMKSLVAVLQACADGRGLAAPLNAAELEAYAAAMAAGAAPTALPGNLPARMALAAKIAGCEDEARFWRQVPATLASLQKSETRAQVSNEASLAQSSQIVEALWSPEVERATALERSAWHAQLNRRVFESSEALQERRVLELLSLGDLQAAVGLLLSSPPGRSTRFYRDALCTLGMAFACGLQQHPSEGGGPVSDAEQGVLDVAARSLFVQAAKVITANAATVGDSLIGVPLLCSTGQFDDAATILQDVGMWSYAAALVAGSLTHAARAAHVERWATHVAEAEGRVWAAVGLLVGCGRVESALELLGQAGMPHAAAALAAAAGEAGLEVEGADKAAAAYEAYVQGLLAGGRRS